jgi:hypothetical protein
MPEKTCTKCGQPHPATTEFFPPNARGVFGLSSWCRSCYRTKCREDQRRKRKAAKESSIEDDVCKLPDGRVQEVDLGNGRRGVRFGREWKPTHPETDTRALRGWASPLTSIYL